MSRTTLDRLRDARAHARAALENGGGLSPEALAAARQPLHAVLYDLTQVLERDLQPLIAALGQLISALESGNGNE